MKLSGIVVRMVVKDRNKGANRHYSREALKEYIRADLEDPYEDSYSAKKLVSTRPVCCTKEEWTKELKFFDKKPGITEPVNAGKEVSNAHRAIFRSTSNGFCICSD